MTPKSTCSKQAKSFNSIKQKVKNIPCNRFARQSGFKLRKAKKITGKSMILGFFMLALQNKNTLQGWAEQIYRVSGKMVSKQAIWSRISDGLIRFLMLVLKFETSHEVSINSKQVKMHPVLKGFKRILLQDSTTLALPDMLYRFYPGNINRGKQKAVLKIQVLYDLVSQRFVHFEITPFTANDQSKSADILTLGKKGDLVIRDMGYFSLDCFEQMLSAKISFISRVKYGVNVFDTKTGKQINVLAVLRKNHRFDQLVLMGSKQHVAVRLVIEPLPAQQANCRRRKARQDRDERLHHSKQYYELLGYQLLITSEDATVFTPTQITKIYGLRWRIESIFKCWKSQFNLQRLIDKSISFTKQRVQAIIYLMLLFILLFQVTVYNYVQSKASQIKNTDISMLKLCRYISSNVQRFLENPLNKLLDEIIYYCCYEHRDDRLTFIQKLKLT